MKTSRTLIALLFVSAAAGCSPDTKGSSQSSSISSERTERTSPSTPEPARPPLVFSRTNALVRDPELAKAVDTLASDDAIESSHIGAAGAPSTAFAHFEVVKAKATSADLVALLRHESPVVRGYVAQHVARNVGAAVPELEPLLRDNTQVKSISGCMVSDHGTVGGIVMEAACFSDLPEAVTFVKTIASADGPLKANASGCLGRKDPERATAIALEEVRRDPPGKNVAAFVRILSSAPPDAACTAFVSLARSADADVRHAVSQALPECKTPGALDALDMLATDADELVARTAKAAIAVNPATDDAKREALLGDPKLAHLAANILDRKVRGKGFDALLPMVEKLVIAHPREMSQVVGALGVHDGEPNAIAAIRRIAASVPPSSQIVIDGRAPAIAILAKHPDTADLPEFRRSLASANVSELIDALGALGALHDVTSRDAIARLESDRNVNVANAAKAALAKLR